MESPTSKLRSFKHSAPQIMVYMLAFVGALATISGAFPKTRYELDHGAYIATVRTSWWGLKSHRYPIRLQHHGDWERGRPYRPPPEFEEYDWFIKGQAEEWYPMDFIGPPEPSSS
jgi:hypothetical protein